MTDAEIFDNVVRRCGLGVRYEPKTRMTFDHWNRTYGHIHRYANHLIESARQILPNLPPIYFDFIYNPQMNAWAFKHQGRYFIGITTGLRYMTEFVFFRMLSDARMFPNIGNPEAESSLPPITNYSTDADDIHQQGLYTGPPKDAARRDYAIELITRAMFFVIGHELAHITRGHIDYLNSHTGTSIISECGEPNAAGLGIAWKLPRNQEFAESQAIEMDADKRSVMSAISTLKNKHESPE